MFFWSVLGVILFQRLFELWLTIGHTRWMKERGGREYGRGHYPWMFLLHSTFLCSMILEYLRRSREPYLICLAPLAVAQVLRYTSMWALGKFWNTRVWVVPGVAPIRRGIYRLMTHPNYVAVALEFFFLPAMFGLWITAVVFGSLNASMLSVRIKVENRALRREAD